MCVVLPLCCVHCQGARGVRRDTQSHHSHGMEMRPCVCVDRASCVLCARAPLVLLAILAIHYTVQHPAQHAGEEAR